ncbi:MAG: hypothetical protein LLG16_07275 [Euryarchaeota archaeon]|nr:hypothetical protein [Euryarchaeota archaeon]
MAPLSFRLGRVAPRSETGKIASILVESLASPLALERRRMENRVITLAKKEPIAVVEMLLHFYDSDIERVRDSIKSCLLEISKMFEAKETIIESLTNSDKNIRKGAKLIIPDIWGPPSTPYSTLFEQTYQMIQIAKEKDIPVEDIETLMDLSKQTFLDGESMKAINDIGTCLEFVKRRYKNSESLKVYIADMLKLSPDIQKSGVTIVNFNESLKTVIKVSKKRSFDFTQEVIDQRIMEMELKDQLRSMGQLVKETVRIRPVIEMASLSVKDERLIFRMAEVFESVNTKNLSGNPSKSIETLHEFLFKDFEWYYDDEVITRLSEGDMSAMLTIYMLGISVLKVVSSIIPSVSEEIYQKYYRDLEGSVSIYTVMWPELVMELAKGMTPEK